MRNTTETLINGDCIEKMKDVPDKSVELILTDLPYGTTACKWDAIIPFDELWDHYHRILTDDGNIVLTASQPFTTKVINSNIDNFRYEWIWVKPQGTNPLLSKYQPMKNHESILVFSKKRGNYYPIMESGEPYKGFESDESTIGEVYNNLKSIHKENNGTRYPKSVQSFSQDRGLHPTQKPIEMMEYIIKTYTLEGDTVLDSCMGSGTTGVAAKNLYRNFIGIEKEQKYFNLASNRINEHLVQANIFE